MTTYSGTNLIGSSPGVFVGSSLVDKLYAGANLVWQRADTTAPTQPPSFSASASGTTISLSWGAATDNVAVTGYRLYRGGSLLTTTTGFSYTDSGLSYSTTYSYSVSAIDAAGNESTKATASATTGSAPPPPPPAVTYPYTVTTMSYNDRPFNGSDSNGSFTRPGSYLLGSVYLDPSHSYQISGYFYADSSQNYNNGTNPLYNNGYVTASFSGGPGLPSGTASTSNAGYSRVSGTFSGVGTTSFYINVSDSFYCGPGGSPMLTVTAVG